MISLDKKCMLLQYTVEHEHNLRAIDIIKKWDFGSG